MCYQRVLKTPALMAKAALLKKRAREICPQMPPFEPCDGEPVVRAQHGYFAFAEKCAPRSASPCRKASALAFDQVPTSFDLTKMNTLLPVSEMRGVRQILSDAIADLKAKGVVQ